MLMNKGSDLQHKDSKKDWVRVSITGAMHKTLTHRKNRKQASSKKSVRKFSGDNHYPLWGTPQSMNFEPASCDDTHVPRGEPCDETKIRQTEKGMLRGKSSLTFWCRGTSRLFADSSSLLSSLESSPIRIGMGLGVSMGAWRVICGKWLNETVWKTRKLPAIQVL